MSFQRYSYEQLLENIDHDFSALTYYELLSTNEWETRRQDIIKRDKFTCCKCNKGDTILKIVNGVKEYYWVTIPDNVRRYKNSYVENNVLMEYYILDDRDFIYTKAQRHHHLHVHHKYYIKGTLPWNYNDDCFETLCVHCHYELHKKEIIPVYFRTANGLIEKTNMTPCKRCFGAGILPDFDYFMGGICFRCFGAKFEEFITPKLKKRSKEQYNNFRDQFIG
jgi:hypothetical protein